AGDNGTDRGGQQKVNQQAVGFGVLMSMPVDIKQADKQPAQAKGYQPDGVQRRKINGGMKQRAEGGDGLDVDQDDTARRQRHQAADRPADTGDHPAQRFMEGEKQRQDSGGGKPGHTAGHHNYRVHFAPSLSARSSERSPTSVLMVSSRLRLLVRAMSRM